MSRGKISETARSKQSERGTKRDCMQAEMRTISRIMQTVSPWTTYSFFAVAIKMALARRRLQIPFTVHVVSAARQPYRKVSIHKSWNAGSFDIATLGYRFVIPETWAPRSSALLQAKFNRFLRPLHQTSAAEQIAARRAAYYLPYRVLGRRLICHFSTKRLLSL